MLHIFRLIFDPKIEEFPMEIDWFIVLVGGYGGVGLLVFAKRIPFKNSWDKLACGLLVFHLLGSVIVHCYTIVAGNREILNLFPYEYSYFAVAYFLALGLYALRLNKKLY